jgi:hypothetical protein
MSRPEKSAGDNGWTCLWTETGFQHDVLLRLKIRVALPGGQRGAVRTAEESVRAGGTSYRRVSGVGDSAVAVVGEGYTSLYGVVGFAEGSREAVVRARTGNVVVFVDYQEESADDKRVLAVALALTRQILHNAVGAPDTGSRAAPAHPDELPTARPALPRVMLTS